MVDEPDYMDEEALWDALPASEGFRRGDVLFNLALRLNDKHDHERALACADEAVTAFQAAGFEREVGRSHTLSGITLDTLGRGDEAYERFRTASDIFERIGETSEMSAVHAGIADYHMGRHEWDEAVTRFQAQYDLAREVHHRRDMAVAAASIAEVYSTTGGHDDLVIANCSMALAAGVGDAPPHWTAGVREKQAFALARQGKVADALVEMRKNVSVARQCDCRECLVNALIAQADVMQDAGDWAGAESLMAEASAISKELASGAATAIQGHVLLCRAHQASGDEALRLTQEADAVYETVGDMWGQGNCLRQFGRLAAARGDFEAAIAHYYAAGAIQSEGPGTAVAHDIARAVASIHLDRGDALAAITVLESSGWAEHGATVTSRDRAHHCVLYAKAVLESGEAPAAVGRAERLLVAIADEAWFDIAAQAHEVRALGLMHRDPAGSERAAQRAQACYNRAGMHEDATRIGTQFFIEPYERLAKIDVDNQLRAEAQAAEARVREADAAERIMDIVAKSAANDPIEAQVERRQGDPGAASA